MLLKKIITIINVITTIIIIAITTMIMIVITTTIMMINVITTTIIMIISLRGIQNVEQANRFDCKCLFSLIKL